MLRKYLTCDICGSKWDITNTPFDDRVDPGTCYRNAKVMDGVRKFGVYTLTAHEDTRVSMENLDMCDKCYNKLDRFIYELANEEEEDVN